MSSQRKASHRFLLGLLEDVTVNISLPTASLLHTSIFPTYFAQFAGAVLQLFAELSYSLIQLALFLERHPHGTF
jgi:hypothetical protein